LKNKEIEEVYLHKREILNELETLAEKQTIDLYYADESRVSLEPCIPYGWQFPTEEVFMPTSKGSGLNCFALLSRTNQCLVKTGEQTFSSQFILEQFETLSFNLRKFTVVVLDNARIHTSQIIKERIKIWRSRGLYRRAIRYI
jgi:DDE superfamily endonuclease